MSLKDFGAVCVDRGENDQGLHSGFVSLTWNIYVGGGLTVLSGLARKPESAPSFIFLQGSGKVDWVRVWFMDMKVNSTMSPGMAVRVFGVKTRPVSPPTMTCGMNVSNPYLE